MRTICLKVWLDEPVLTLCQVSDWVPSQMTRCREVAHTFALIRYTPACWDTLIRHSWMMDRSVANDVVFDSISFFISTSQNHRYA